MGMAKSPNGHAVSRRSGDGDLLNRWLVALGRWARPRLVVAPWSSGLGLARTLLALGSGLTLIATPTDVLLSGGGVIPRAGCFADSAAGAFCVVPVWHGELMRWCAVAALLLVASGWRPRLTAIPHWYLSWSLLVNSAVPDGGDQLTAILTLLLVPVGLTDRRRWHWQDPAPSSRAGVDRAHAGTASLIAYVAIALIHIQVAVVYFQSSVAKLGVAEWADGTAMYYFLQHQLFGAPPWLSPVTDLVTHQPLGVSLLTWTPLAIEFAIAVAILLRPPVRRVLLVLGFALHATIGLTMGLVSFGVAMCGALLLYLLPIGYQLRFEGLSAATRRVRARLAVPEPAGSADPAPGALPLRLLDEVVGHRRRPAGVSFLGPARRIRTAVLGRTSPGATAHRGA
jgi:antimicrobial peptide system SdpB family protein